MRWTPNPAHGIADPPRAGRRVDIVGDEAQHAVRVKRLDTGSTVGVLDGRGTIATGAIVETGKTASGKHGEWFVGIEIDECRLLPRPKPEIEIASAVPKGGRVDDMIDAVAQTGADRWRPLVCERSAVDPREGKLDRAERIAIEASKQCGRAWDLQIEAKTPVRDLITTTPDPRVVQVVADPDGEPVGAWRPDPDAELVRVLVGPEGGFSAAELEQMDATSVQRIWLGPHLMRIGTAAVVAAGLLNAVIAPERIERDEQPARGWDDSLPRR